MAQHAWCVIVNMNRLLGFFKEKLIEAKEQNQSQIQNILSAIEFEAYSEAKMLNYLQEIKTNYLEWNIMIANEASTGLYYTQIHNKTAIIKRIKTAKDSQDKQERLAIVLQQMRKTLKELQAIEQLNYQWTNSINQKVQRLAQEITTPNKQTKAQAQTDQPRPESHQSSSIPQETVEVPPQAEQKQENSHTSPTQNEPPASNDPHNQQKQS